MPYAADVYTVPPGTLATTLTAIDSSDYNAFANDIQAAQNAARPVVAGGTGGTTQIAGWNGLSTKGTDIASAGTINLTNATGPYVDITGTTSITAVTLANGTWRIARATGAFLLTASASLLVNGSASVNYTTAVGDMLIFTAQGGVTSVTIIGAAGGSNASGLTSTATAAGTTTLTASSTRYQEFTGSTTQTIVLPVVTTLAAKGTFTAVIINTSTGILTANSSGGNLVATVPPSTSVTIVNALITGTAAASWDVIGPTAQYSSGTFTPAFSSTSAVFSYALQQGTYTKIGNNVTVSLKVALNTSGNTLNGNPLSITGLPFALNAGIDLMVPINWSASTTSYISMVGSIASSAASITIRGSTVAGASNTGTVLANNAALHATNQSIMWLNFSYPV